MAIVSIREPRKSFGSFAVLHRVGVAIEDAEFVGPSGCGKSALLRMLAGFENIAAGEIAIGGRVVDSVAPRDRDTAMVFQNYALLCPDTTIRRQCGDLRAGPLAFVSDGPLIRPARCRRRSSAPSPWTTAGPD